MRIIQSLYEKVDFKGKIQALGKKEKRSFDPIFLLCVQSEVNKMKQKLMIIILIYFLYYRSGYCFSQ